MSDAATMRPSATLAAYWRGGLGNARPEVPWEILSLDEQLDFAAARMKHRIAEVLDGLGYYDQSAFVRNMRLRENPAFESPEREYWR